MQNDAAPSPIPGCDDEESRRSRALHDYGVLDTPREAEFDDLARIAAEVCGTPIAVVNLVDTRRQFFKAEVGLGVRETPLDTSFCGHAILVEDIMIVPDATKDARFAGNPLVAAEGGLRFYAGALLKTPEGLTIGTLCVLDLVPRTLDDAQIRTLRLLARQAMTQLELRKAVSARDEALARQRAHARRNRKILDSAVDFAIVVTDREGRVTDWTRGAQTVFGWSEAEMLGAPAERLFTPEDRLEGRAGMEMALALRDGRADGERWHLRRDGSRFWASGEMTPLLGEDEGHLGFVKVLRERTAEHLAGERLRRTEMRLRQAQEAGGIGVFTVEIASGLLEASPEFSRLFGLDHRDRRPAEHFERLVLAEDQALVSRNSTRRAGAARTDVEYRILRPDTGETRWIARKGEFERDADGTPLRFIGVAQDITGRKQTEARQGVLNRELSHRLKNTLAIVQSIATQTLRAAPDTATARRSLSERIQALANAHDILLEGSRDAGGVAEIIGGAVGVHDAEGRFVLSGPEVMVGPKAALTLALICHELATNAVKYGALSAPEGTVSIGWTVSPDAGEGGPVLAIDWTEAGGPPVAEPGRRGFGTRLIEMGLSAGKGASAAIAYPAEGLRCRILAPLAELADEGTSSIAD